MIVREAVVVQQHGDPLRRCPLGPPVFIPGLVIAQAKGLPALFCDRELIQQLRRRLAVIPVHLRMVELEGVDPPVSHILAAALVNMLGRVNLIDPSAGIHVHVTPFCQGCELLVGKRGLVHSPPALQGLDHRVRRRRGLRLPPCRLRLILLHLRRPFRGGGLCARRHRLRGLRALRLLGRRWRFFCILAPPAVLQVLPPGSPVPRVHHPGCPVHGLRHTPPAFRRLHGLSSLRGEHSLFSHHVIGAVGRSRLVVPNTLPDIPPGQVHAAGGAAHGHAGQSAAHAGPYHLRHAVQVRLLPGLVLVHAHQLVLRHQLLEVGGFPHDGGVRQDVGDLRQHFLTGLRARLLGSCPQQVLHAVDGLGLQQLLNAEPLEHRLRRAGGQTAPERLGIAAAPLQHVHGLLAGRAGAHQVRCPRSQQRHLGGAVSDGHAGVVEEGRHVLAEQLPVCVIRDLLGHRVPYPGYKIADDGRVRVCRGIGPQVVLASASSGDQAGDVDSLQGRCAHGGEGGQDRMLVRPRFRLLPLALRLRRPLLPLLVLRHALVVIARRADAVRLFQQLRLQRLPDGGQIPAVLPGQSVLPGDLPHSLVDGILRHGARCRHPGLLQGLDAVQCAPDLVRPGKAGLHGGIFRQPRPLLFVFLLIIAVSEFRKLPVVILPGAVGFLRRAVSLPGIRLCGHPRSPCGDLRTPEIQEFLLGLVPQRPQLLRPALRLPCRGCDLSRLSGSCWPPSLFSSGGFARRLTGHRRQGGGLLSPRFFEPVQPLPDGHSGRSSPGCRSRSGGGLLSSLAALLPSCFSKAFQPFLYR